MASKNPPDFPIRLQSLMEGAGLSLRALSAKTGDRVAHSTIADWLKDRVRATPDEVALVAEVFGWTTDELYYGHGGRETMNRFAETEAELRKARRLIVTALPGLMEIGGVATVDEAVAAARKPPSRRAEGE